MSKDMSIEQSTAFVNEFFKSQRSQYLVIAKQVNTLLASDNIRPHLNDVLENDILDRQNMSEIIKQSPFESLEKSPEYHCPIRGCHGILNTHQDILTHLQKHERDYNAAANK
jgi:hypothetical protein